MRGASTWLSTLPLMKNNTSLLKQEFCNLVKIRYGWALSRLPNMSSYNVKYDLQHILSCTKCGFSSLRCNHLCNITANLIVTVHHDVRVGSPL